MTSFFFIIRLALASMAAYALLAGMVLNGLLPHGAHFEGFVVGTASLLGAFAALNAFSHVRRVRLIAGKVSGATVSSRQRRQIEVPFEAGEAFDLIDAAIRELPGSEIQESARDSLQVQARVRRPAPYTQAGTPRWHLLNFFEPRPNQILATVTPNGEAGSVTLICEPARTAWTDWFLVDHGTNLENAEAVTRAITRRVAQRRRGEQAEVRQTVTEKELTVAKLSLLHAQVEPHFLYNTLTSAQLLTRSDPARADEMLGNLIEYLRHSLPRTENAMSSIGVELERAKAYLDILKIRMGSRLNLQIEVPQYLKQVELPPMMLQTLVENAIKHGLEPKSGGGTIWILARAGEGTVAITVADDGQGFSDHGGGTGIGLRNVRERLRLTYGDAALFSIVSNFPGGVAATITVPDSTARGAAYA
ncbi:histidine kinase [Janthinobacterium sp.]|uniref:histidine kinase n=1 Tax=Janthinobacterium sp. TaxID=1871054 RepID=UPI00289B6F81|nr:histidine kinase [Janthinobacterium sp.]